MRGFAGTAGALLILIVPADQFAAMLFKQFLLAFFRAAGEDDHVVLFLVAYEEVFQLDFGHLYFVPAIGVHAGELDYFFLELFLSFQDLFDKIFFRVFNPVP